MQIEVDKIGIPNFFFLPLCVSLLVVSCQPKGWVVCNTLSDYPQFNSAQMLHTPDNSFNGIEIQLLRGSFGIVGYLNVCSMCIPSNTVIFYIAGTQYQFTGVVLEGGQRLLLPSEATEKLIQALLSRCTVDIYLEGFQTKVLPYNFAVKYVQFID